MIHQARQWDLSTGTQAERNLTSAKMWRAGRLGRERSRALRPGQDAASDRRVVIGRPAVGISAARRTDVFFLSALFARLK